MPEEPKPGLVTRKDWRILAIALLLGAVAVVLLNVYVNARHRGEKLVSVLVANQELKATTQLDASMLKAVPLPASAVTDRAVKPADMAMVTGYSLTVDLDKGQPLYYQFVSGMLGRDRTGLNWEQRQRLYCIRFDNPLTDAVQENDLVDIYGTFLEGNVTKAFQLLPRVRVWGRSGPYLVLMVQPQAALMLEVARLNVMSLTFAIRSQQENFEVTADTVVRSDMIIPYARKLASEQPVRVPSRPSDEVPSGEVPGGGRP